MNPRFYHELSSNNDSSFLREHWVSFCQRKQSASSPLRLITGRPACRLPAGAFAYHCFRENTMSTFTYFFVHGLSGWGSYDKAYRRMPYWGMRSGDLISFLRGKGFYGLPAYSAVERPDADCAAGPFLRRSDGAPVIRADGSRRWRRCMRRRNRWTGST